MNSITNTQNTINWYEQLLRTQNQTNIQKQNQKTQDSTSLNLAGLQSSNFSQSISTNTNNILNNLVSDGTIT